MLATNRFVLAIYVDRSTRQWIVRDRDGNFWIVPPGEHSWEQREPFEPSDDTDLAPVPGHYRSLFQLPT
jgi:hypothetical protein